MHGSDPFLKKDITALYKNSLLIAALMSAASVAGLLLPGYIYPTQALRQSFMSNDVVNLLLGLPILLGSLALSKRGKLIGLLFWPGALLYILYNSLAYALAQPLTWQFGFYLVLVLLCAVSVYRLFTSLDRVAIQQELIEKVPARLSAVILVGFGLLFFVMRAGVVLQALGKQEQISAETAVAVADLIMTPLWVIGGISLWQRRPLGYASGLAFLFQGAMLFLGLLVFFLLQPFLAGVTFPVEDFVVILVMGLIFFVPFGLYVRGVLFGSSAVSPPF